VLALATPGLLDPLGPQAVRDHLVGVAAPLRERCDKLLLRAGGTDPAGDVILLLGKADGLAPEVAADWVLDADEHAPAAARRHVREQLQCWGLPEEATYTTDLLVSELVTNVVRYGRSPCRLRLIRGEQLTVEVRDGAASSPHVRHARTTDEGGRGLYIVAALADRWGVRTTTRGKTARLEQPLESRPAFDWQWQGLATEPVDTWTPALIRRVVSLMDVYCGPWSDFEVLQPNGHRCHGGGPQGRPLACADLESGRRRQSAHLDGLEHAAFDCPQP
jgi:anti-sigma regulatory factor (Ser/Thr protein kinase)